MWVYWITLGALSIILYFPYKRLFSKELALRAAVATFILGLFYPLLQARLSFWQTFFCLGLLLLFLGVTISRKHPQWDKDDTSEPRLSSPEEQTFTELNQDKIIDRAAKTSLPELNPIIPVQSQQDEEPEIEYIPSIEDILIDNKKEVATNIVADTAPKLPEQKEPALEIYPVDSKVETLPQSSEQEAYEDTYQSPQEVVLEENICHVTVDEPTDLNEGYKEIIQNEASDMPISKLDIDSLDIQYEQESPYQSNSDNNTFELPVNEDIDQDIDAEIIQPEPVETCDASEQHSEVYEVAPEPSQTPITVAVNTQQLLAEGLRLSQNKNYTQAVRYFNQVLSSNPGQDILYLTVSELSSLYQHLGLYQMASDIIKTFIEQPNLMNHPGLKHLSQKMKFIECLIYLLKRDNYGQIPYNEVPEAVRREAFDNSLNIKRLFS